MNIYLSETFINYELHYLIPRYRAESGRSSILPINGLNLAAPFKRMEIFSGKNILDSPLHTENFFSKLLKQLLKAYGEKLENMVQAAHIWRSVLVSLCLPPLRGNEPEQFVSSCQQKAEQKQRISIPIFGGLQIWSPHRREVMEKRTS